MTELRITKPDRVLWPRLGLTKAWMLGYYRSVADVLLPHLRGHPVTLHRFPEGVDEAHWYQTRAPAHPEWVHTVNAAFRRLNESLYGPQEYAAIATTAPAEPSDS